MQIIITIENSYAHGQQWNHRCIVFSEHVGTIVYLLQGSNPVRLKLVGSIHIINQQSFNKSALITVMVIINDTCCTSALIQLLIKQISYKEKSKCLYINIFIEILNGRDKHLLFVYERRIKEKAHICVWQSVSFDTTKMKICLTFVVFSLCLAVHVYGFPVGQPSKQENRENGQRVAGIAKKNDHADLLVSLSQLHGTQRPVCYHRTEFH